MSAIQAPCEVEDIEYLDAMQVVLAARQSATLRQMSDDQTRARWAARFDQVMDEFRVAAIVMRNGSAPHTNDIPPYLAKGSTIPLSSRAFLRCEADAAFHE